jgi:spermidine/putrescine-binding protein
MLQHKLFTMAMLCLSASLIISCGSSDSGARKTQAGEKNDDPKVLNLFIWSDYLAPDTIASFEKLTGVKCLISIPTRR